MTTDLIMRVSVRTTTTTAALEARNLKNSVPYISSTVIITDYLLLYHRLLTHTTCCQTHLKLGNIAVLVV